MGQLIRQKVSETPVAQSFVNADTGAGDKVNNPDGLTFLVFKNLGASDAVATITAQKTSKDVVGFGPMTKANLVISMPATNDERIVGPFPQSAWNDGNGDINIAYSGSNPADIDVVALVSK